MGQEAESGAANPLPAATSSRLGGRGNGNEATKHAEPAKQQQQQGNACIADGCREANRRRHRKYKTGAKGGEYSRVSTLVGILVDGCVRMGGDVLLERRVGSRCKERLGPPWSSLFHGPSSVRPPPPTHPRGAHPSCHRYLATSLIRAVLDRESNLQRPFSVKQGRAIGSACRNPARSLVDPWCH